MDADGLIAVFKLIARSAGVKKSRFFSRWSVFAYPFWGDSSGKKVGFKVLYYMGVDSTRTRITKMVLGHALSVFVNGIGTTASGFGQLGPAMENTTKFGNLKSAFDVDIGAIQLASVLESSDDPSTISSAIILSGKLLRYAVVRVDESDAGWHIHIRSDTSPNSYTEWGVNNIDTIEENATRYTAFKNGWLVEGTTKLGDYKTGKLA